MKKALAFLVAFTALSGTFLSAQELQVYYFPRPPLYISNPDGSVGGFVSEIVKLVLAEAKIPNKWLELPSARVEASLKAKEYGVGIGWYKNPTREEWANFSNPIYQDLPLVAIMSKKNAAALGKTITLDELLRKGLSLGVIENFSYGAVADAAILAAKTKTEKVLGDQSQLITMLEGARFDFMILGLEEASYLFETKATAAAALAMVKISDAPVGNSRYLMFSKAIDKTVIDKVNAAIAKVMKTEAYKKLTDFSKYLK